MPFIAVKGTHDLYGAEADGYAYIENVFLATLSAKKCIPSWIKGIVR